MRLLFSIILAIPLSSLTYGAAVDGAKVHWTSTGTAKKAVILVHGWTCDESSWDAQVPVLSQNIASSRWICRGTARAIRPRTGSFR